MNGARQGLIAAVGAAAQAFQRSTDAFDDVVCQRLGINRTDLRCLDWLFEAPLPAGQLAEATGLSSAATTALVDRLETRGLVRRVRSTTDRRKVLVELTELARRVAGQYYGPLAAEGAARLDRFTDDQLTAICEYLLGARELTDEYRARIDDQRLEPAETADMAAQPPPGRRRRTP